MRLKRLQKKAFMQVIGLLKVLKYEQVPIQVIEELKKYNIVKTESETMEDFTNKILKYVKDKEQTI